MEQLNIGDEMEDTSGYCIVYFVKKILHQSKKIYWLQDVRCDHEVIVDANNLTVEIENELNIIPKFIRDTYSKRFLELESLVPNTLDYIRTVKELGNSLDKCRNDENLQQILTNATIMVVSVTASTTKWKQLSDEELERLEEACDMALELNASKHGIYEYVESRMSFIAPNLSIIIGASTAAKIMEV
ncbi:U4/U6 small nuclear ribonucleoprotein Prp31-like protein [Cricetulus griseus]|uniref:U4/U6 small nuclear ribonucleoprotein Prp31-like protein n=1 Tax=Cricetulus griseus TaxID=10029 RepID=A0A061IQI4_CRIGR|nr:U4/U6 small nuclear ribonucleoprotein Prp31-like protein [Cricetulus griseus]